MVKKILIGLLCFTTLLGKSQEREYPMYRPLRTYNGFFMGENGDKIDSVILSVDTLLLYVDGSSTPFKTFLDIKTSGKIDSAAYSDTSEFALNVIIPENNILEWDIANYYRPYTSRSAGVFYTGTTDPLSTNRLNFDGRFYSTSGNFEFPTGGSVSGDAPLIVYNPYPNSTQFGSTITTIRPGVLQLNQNGTYTSAPHTSHVFDINRTINTANVNIEGNVVNIVDNPTVSAGIITGKILSATVDGTERISLNPRSNITGTAYMFDTDDSLTTGYILDIKNKGNSVFIVTPDSILAENLVLKAILPELNKVTSDTGYFNVIAPKSTSVLFNGGASNDYLFGSFSNWIDDFKIFANSGIDIQDDGSGLYLGSGTYPGTSSGGIYLDDGSANNSVSGSGIYLTSSSGSAGDQSYLDMDGTGVGNVELGHSLGAKLNLNETGATLTGVPLNYSADYSGSYTDRSLVDKEYIDNVLVGNNIFDSIIINNHTLKDVPQDQILDWDTVNSYYRPYSAKAAGKLYTGTSDPTSSNRLNYDGDLHSRSLYADGGLLDVAGSGQFSSIGITFEPANTLKIQNIPATATTPVYLINKNTSTTGIGGTNNYVSLIVNGVEALRASNNTVSTTVLTASNTISATDSISTAKLITDTLTTGLLIVDSIQGMSTDTVIITGDLLVRGIVYDEHYEAAAYLSPDSTIVTSVTTSFSFLGGGQNNKFTQLYMEGFMFDGDTLTFDQDASDMRDSIEFRISYSCESSFASNNRTVLLSIFIKSVGGSYRELPQTTKRSRTISSGVYYAGPSCTTIPIYLKDGDKIQIRAKCQSTTGTLSTQSFGIYLYEE